MNGPNGKVISLKAVREKRRAEAESFRDRCPCGWLAPKHLDVVYVGTKLLDVSFECPVCGCRLLMGPGGERKLRE